jgi:hypothetical protein
MANIITCNNIQAESERLQSLFEPCYTLTAADLDDIVTLIYSVSLCDSDSESLTQDNIVGFVYPPTITEYNDGSPVSTADAATAINEMDGFTVTDTDLIIFRIRQDNFSSGGDDGYGRGLDVTTHWYQLMNVGAGSYGSSGTQLANTNLFWIRSTENVSLGTDYNTQPIVYELDTSTEANLNNPHTVVNIDTGTYEVLNTADYYFRIILNEKTTTSKTADVPTGHSSLYRFVGDAGEYGIGGGDTSVSGDYELVETVGDDGDDGSSDDVGITFRTIYPSYVIDSTENISDAVNNSFRGDVNIGDHEVVGFIVQRQDLEDDNSLKIYNERYVWTGGVATIQADSEESDFTLYETDYQGTVASIVNAEPIVAIVWDSNISDPATAVDNNSETFTIDGTSDYYFSVYYTNGKPRVASAYNLYRYTGSNGTFGSGGSATKNTDYTLVLSDGDGKGKTDPADNVPTTTSELTNDGDDGTNEFISLDDLPLTTKGDIFTNNGTDNARLAAGVNGQVIIADSSQSLGVKWGEVSGTLLQVSSSLSSADLKSLGTTPITIVAAQGSGQVIEIISAFAELTYLENAYADEQIGLSTTGNISTSQFTFQGILAGTVNGIIYKGLESTSSNGSGKLESNTALKIMGTDAATGTSTIALHVTYHVVDTTI